MTCLSMRNFAWCILWMTPWMLSSQGKAPLTLSGAESQVALVVDLSTGDTLYRYHETQRVTPASLTKLFTTVAALDLLSPDFRYETTVYNDHEQRRLVVKAGGDPTLGSSFFESQSCDKLIGLITSALQARGISSLEEGVVVDLSYFGQVLPPSPRMWEDMGNYFGALPASLTVDDNTFRLYLDSPSKVGELCAISRMKPAWGELPQSRVKASHNLADSAYIYGVAGCDNWYVSGSIPAGRKDFMIKGALPEPYRWFGLQLQQALSQKRIPVKDVTYCFDPVEVDNSSLVSFPSPSLERICRVVNKHSNNLYAEHLFLSLGKSCNRPNWDGGAFVLSRYCREKVGTRSLLVYDGSGLSPFNSFSAGDMVKLLHYASKQPFFDDFYASLSVSGVDGTLRNLWRDEATKGHIRGKSGTMNGVLGYAGYISTNDNRLLAFCIVINHHSEQNSIVRQAVAQWVGQFVNPL